MKQYNIMIIISIIFYCNAKRLVKFIIEICESVSFSFAKFKYCIIKRKFVFSRINSHFVKREQILIDRHLFCILNKLVVIKYRCVFYFIYFDIPVLNFFKPLCVFLF